MILRTSRLLEDFSPIETLGTKWICFLHICTYFGLHPTIRNLDVRFRKTRKTT